MKNSYLVISIILWQLTAMSQTIIHSEKKTVTKTGEVNVSKLPAPDKNYKQAKMEEEWDVEQNESTPGLNKTKKPDNDKYTVPVQVVRPVEKNPGQLVPAPLINESPCITYPGLNRQNFFPPDVSSAVGFDHLFMALNDSMCIMDKYGTILRKQRQNDGTGFWSPIDTTALFDPKIIYEPFHNRWLYVIATDARTAQSAFLIAVSQSPDPMQGWDLYRVDTDADNDQWFDYPSIGFNKNWFVVNGNMGNNNGSGVTECRTFIFNINQLFAGGPVTYTVNNYANLLDPQFTFCPALTYDPAMNDLWLVTNDDVNDNDLRYFKITGSPSSPVMTEESFISIGTAWGEGNGNIGTQLGSTARIHAGDHDVLSVVWRNNRLYTAQTIFLPDGNSPLTCTIQITVSDPYTQTVFEALRFGSDANNMYAFPCLAVNQDNDLIISCSKFTSFTYPSAAVLVRRNGTPTFYETVFKAGESTYLLVGGDGRNRWGDYTSAMVDPADDNSVWVSSEYSRPNAGSEYGTWWAKICSGSCAAITIVNSTQTSGTLKKYEASFIVYGQSEIQSGADIKLNAGSKIILQPGFKALQGCRIRTYLEGCGGVQ